MYAVESVRFGGMLGKKRYDKRPVSSSFIKRGLYRIASAWRVRIYLKIKMVSIGNVIDLDDFRIHYDITQFWFNLIIMHYAN